MLIPTQISISESEWEIMRVVWANGSVTSREVIDILKDKMDWKESTIKTLMGRLVEKGALATTKDGRKFIYTSEISEQETVRNYSIDIIDRVCNKQNGNVIHQLIEAAELSLADIRQLQELLEEKENTAPIEVACACTLGQCDCHLT